MIGGLRYKGIVGLSAVLQATAAASCSSVGPRYGGPASDHPGGRRFHDHLPARKNFVTRAVRIYTFRLTANGQRQQLRCLLAVSNASGTRADAFRAWSNGESRTWSRSFSP